MCDKDYQNVYNIVDKIKETALYDYEIFVMDNREKKKNIILNFENAKLVDMGGNKYQFNAKREAVLNYCSGDYVWFIDCDDEIIDCPNIVDNTSEIICFNYDISVKVSNVKADVRYHFDNDEILEGELHSHYTLENYLKIGVPNWAKLFRLDLLKQFYEKTGPIELHLAEDCLVILYMMYNSTKITLQNKVCYLYIISKKSDTGAQNYTNLDAVKRMFTGSRNSGKVVDMFIPKDIQEKTTLSNEMVDNTTFTVFKEYFFKVEDSIKQQYINEIGKKYFSEQELTKLIDEINNTFHN